MMLGKSLGLALAGIGLLAATPSALADEPGSLQDRIQDLEKQVMELKTQLGGRDQAEPLSVQVEKYLQEQEKGSLWVDRNGKPLGKTIDSMWFTMSMRMRPTYSKNLFDFTDGDDDSGWTTLQRSRLGVGANLHSGVSAYIELDMVGSWGNSSTSYANDGGFTVTPTVQQAYIDGLYSKQLNAKTRLGRFEMSYGDEYVIGDRDFFQAGLAFDGAWMSKNYENHGFSVDAFALKLVDGFKNGTTATPDDSVYALGLYGNWYGSEAKTGLPGGMQPYYILVKDQADAPGVPGGSTRDVHTAGVYWFGDKATKDKGGMYWNVNLSGQYWKKMMVATDSRLGYTMSNTKWTPKFFGQFAYAAGDMSNPGGAAYNPLFQDAHGRFGYSDLIAFSNLMSFGVGGYVTPVENLSYGIEFRSHHLAREYAGGGGSQLAWETNLVVKHKYSENVDFEVAYSFVKWRDNDNAPGAGDDVQIGYFNIVLSF
jgi:hypothetical protein